MTRLALRAATEGLALYLGFVREVVTDSEAPRSKPPEVAPVAETPAPGPVLPPRRLHVRLGSATHPGPPTTAADKGNQDFAFHDEIVDADGAVWTIAGVADGVAQSPWSELGARHGAAAFIDAVVAQVHAASDFSSQAVRGAFAERFVEQLLGRIEPERQAFRELKCVPPNWGKDFVTEISEGPLEATNNWHQSTLLAAVVGPRGGFLLLIGDGYAVARVRDGERRSVTFRHEHASDRSHRPNLLLRYALTADEVASAIVPLEGAGDVLEVVVATDGVSDSIRGIEVALEGVARVDVEGATHVLDSVAFERAADCDAVLERLSALSPDLIVEDNMSIAFLTRPTARRRSP